MHYQDYLSLNRRAEDVVRSNKFQPSEVASAMTSYKYRGFVDCCVKAGEASRFLMFLNADDVVAGHYFYSGDGTFESGTLNLWLHLVKQSTWIYDVGAFTGVFALAAAAANPACRVMAFEPSFITYSRLLVNIIANGFDDRVAPVRFGVADNEGELALRHLGGVYVMASGESFSDAQIANPWFTENVPVISLDHLHANQGRYSRQLVLDKIFEGVDLLKIDVEGFEESVLKGMSEIIRTYRPTAIVEILEEAKVPEIHALFGNDYEVFHVVERDGSLSRVEGGPNKLFIHRDRTHLLSDYGSDS